MWRGWADDLSAVQLPGGHFIPEEAPEELTDILGVFLAGDETPPTTS